MKEKIFFINFNQNLFSAKKIVQKDNLFNVVIIPGLLLNGRAVSDLTKVFLQKKANVFTLSFFDFRNAQIITSLTIESLASALFKWLAKQNFHKPVILIGHSSGGDIVTQFLVRFQNKLKPKIIPVIANSNCFKGSHKDHLVRTFSLLFLTILRQTIVNLRLFVIFPLLFWNLISLTKKEKRASFKRIVNWSLSPAVRISSLCFYVYSLDDLFQNKEALTKYQQVFLNLRIIRVEESHLWPLFSAEPVVKQLLAQIKN